ncbi:hypothetical protein KTS45_12495 [Halomicroarcula limicola]|uniref:Uncharacterized protein n=1 Tax=Haloarcula limicola TaxID=1429915 RepID=A0A8J8C3Z4_9EURY|nr:hypothetical protein [Halomicroarcula limicola]MBV0925016.1 hypothetical protein [Halomicroarcula limicola]
MLDLLLENWKYITGFLALFLVAYWTFDERDQSKTVGDTIESVGERAQSATGGVVGAGGSLALAVIAVMSTIGQELVFSLMQIAGIAGSDPVLAGGVVTGLVGTAGLSGALPVKAWQFGLIAVSILAIGVVWRANGAAN